MGDSAEGAVGSERTQKFTNRSSEEIFRYVNGIPSALNLFEHSHCVVDKITYIQKPNSGSVLPQHWGRKEMADLEEGKRVPHGLVETEMNE